MQSLFFLWLQLRMMQQYLRKKTFDPVESPANSADPNTPTGLVTLSRDSIKPVGTIPAAMEPRVGFPPGRSYFGYLALGPASWPTARAETAPQVYGAH